MTVKQIGGITIRPIVLNRFWHRRICEVAAFISLLLVTLQLLPIVMSVGISSVLDVVEPTELALPAITFVVACFGYVLPPKKLLTFGVYALLVATSATMVITTGETQSPFIALWIVVAVFAGIFGWYGYGLVLGLVGSFAGYGIYNGTLTEQGALVAIVAGVAPLIASFIIWHTKSKEDKRDKAYLELASELSHESNRSETVINAINDGVLSIDKKGTIQLINPAAERIIGWSKGDSVGLSYKSVLKLNDRQDKPLTVSNDPIEKVLATSHEVRDENLSILTESGKKVLLSVVVSPIGQPVSGAIIVFRDITKEKSEEREQAEFISTASHEMRTPVASIEGYLGLVLNPATATIDEKAREYVIKAQASAQHLGRLFQDLLDVSRAEDGRMTNNPRVVDVVEYIADITEGLKPKAAEKGLRFLYKPKLDEGAFASRFVTPVYYANVDNDHLREIVANLVENAIKYTPKGDVIVDVTADSEKVTISVQDSGIGIPTEDIPHLFQKFYRVDNSDTREIGGTGLGLYLCRRLAEVMSGQIKVESAYKSGSTFSLVIPRIDHQEAQRLMEVATIAEEMQETKPVIDVQPQQPPVANVPDVREQPATTLGPPATPNVPVSTIAPRDDTVLHPNTPIQQIEQNSAAYLSTRPAITIPPREQHSGYNQS